jgi:hypothetical protein
VPGQDLRDAALSLALRLGDQDSDVHLRQVRRQQPHGREVQAAHAELLEDHWKPLHGPGRLDPVVGRVLGQSQHLGAIQEQRRESRSEVQATSLELGKVSDEARRYPAFASGQLGQPAQDLRIGEIG